MFFFPYNLTSMPRLKKSEAKMMKINTKLLHVILILQLKMNISSPLVIKFQRLTRYVEMKVFYCCNNRTSKLKYNSQSFDKTFSSVTNIVYDCILPPDTISFNCPST